MPARHGIRHLAADFGSRGHTISSLCERTAASAPGDESILVPFTWYRDDGAWLLPEVPLTEHSVVHIGNNPHSLPLLIAARDWPGHVVVVLHDVWLLDLLAAAGRASGDPAVVLHVLHRDLGLHALRAAGLARGGGEIDHHMRVEIAASVCNELLSTHMHAVVHRNSDFVHDVLSATPVHAIEHVPMPVHFHRESMQAPRRPHTWDIALSGFASFSKRIRILEEALHSVSSARPIRVALVGGMASAFDDAFLHPGSSVDRFPTASDAQWEAIHRRTRVGVRLGVGHLGEASGSLRDYLHFGLIVVTDDDSEPIASAPQTIIVSRTATGPQVADALLRALDIPDAQWSTAPRHELEAYREALATLAMTTCPMPDKGELLRPSLTGRS